VLGQTTADAGQDAVVGAAVETSLLRAGHGPRMIAWATTVRIRGRP
jgi:hypothetical protein